MYDLLLFIFSILLHGNGMVQVTWNCFQCTRCTEVHDDLRQLSYGRVVVRSYGRYDVNGFCFRSASFEAARPRVATVNSGVVTRAVDAEGREINYYGIIQNILEFSFAGDKKLEVFFFDCKWFDSIHGIRQNQFGMVEIKHSERLSGNGNFVLAHQV